MSWCTVAIKKDRLQRGIHRDIEMTKNKQRKPILDIFDDGFSVNMNNMTPYKMYEFTYDGIKMFVKKTEDDVLQVFSE